MCAHTQTKPHLKHLVPVHAKECVHGPERQCRSGNDVWKRQNPSYLDLAILVVLNFMNWGNEVAHFEITWLHKRLRDFKREPAGKEADFQFLMLWAMQVSAW